MALATVERLFLKLYARDATENLSVYSKKKMSAILLTRIIPWAIGLNVPFAVKSVQPLDTGVNFFL